MIIKALTLENFKGIRESARIEFAPLTLLFGPNNAGKSTIVQALMYAREVLEQNNCDAGRTELGGDVVDLGGFKNLVHAHDYLNRAIRMRFELDVREIGLPDYTENIREHEFEALVYCNDAIPIRPTAKIARELSALDLWVEFEVAWNKASETAFVRAYRVGVREATYATVAPESTDGRVSINYLNAGVPPFGSLELFDIREVSASSTAVQVESSESEPSTRTLRREYVRRASGWFAGLLDSLLKPEANPVHKCECEVEYIGNVGVAETLPTQFYPADYYDVPPGPTPLNQPVAAVPTVLPKWGQRIQIGREAWQEDDDDGGNEYWEHPYFAQEYLKDVLSTLITGPGERLVEALSHSIYVSPFRDVPTRQYTPVHSPGANRWANGMAAWDFLMHDSGRLVKPVNRWLGEGRLDTGYRIEVTQYLELDTTSPLMAALSKDEAPSYPDWDWIRVKLAELHERTRLQIRHRASNTVVFPRDLGVGISQVIPVIVATLHNTSGIVAIEEPESNIHPAFQVVLADLFLTQAKANPNVLFLVETHSEHLMLRCLRRIRETAKGVNQTADAPSVSPEDIAVHFVEPTVDGPRIRRIEIDEDGDFIDEWPGGFFEESYREKFAGR